MINPHIVSKVVREIRNAFPDTNVKSVYDAASKSWTIILRKGTTTLYWQPDENAFKDTESYDVRYLMEEIGRAGDYQVDAREDPPAPANRRTRGI